MFVGRDKYNLCCKVSLQIALINDYILYFNVICLQFENNFLVAVFKLQTLVSYVLINTIWWNDYIQYYC